jgi:hypothetical protein
MHHGGSRGDWRISGGGSGAGTNLHDRHPLRSLSEAARGGNRSGRSCVVKWLA